MGWPDVRFGSKADMTLETVMSALPLKADMDQHGWDVRFVPKADITSYSIISSAVASALPIGALRGSASNCR
jgi:hypothetical protein